MAYTICIELYRVNFYQITCPSGDISCPTYREFIEIDVLYLTTYMNFNSKKMYLSQVHVHAIHKSNKYMHENNTEMYHLIYYIFQNANNLSNLETRLWWKHIATKRPHVYLVCTYGMHPTHYERTCHCVPSEKFSRPHNPIDIEQRSLARHWANRIDSVSYIQDYTYGNVVVCLWKQGCSSSIRL